jgi:hypothetical protein
MGVLAAILRELRLGRKLFVDREWVFGANPSREIPLLRQKMIAAIGGLHGLCNYPCEPPVSRLPRSWELKIWR